ncbi:MAG: glycohydrolase toxin TNT-related protein, partial [Gammaproteobacteria bacterium]
PAGFDPQNPQSFNRYAYANNNPYRYVDPNGESPLDVGFFIADSINFGLALASGNAGAIASAGADLAASTAGLFSPIPGTGVALKAARAADKVGDAARVAKGADNVAWPPNRGFDGDSAPASLIPGVKVDRYGSPNGTFVSPDGTPFPNRSLPASSASKPLNTYEVVKPIQVDAGSAVPWFNQSGGGTQFELPGTVKNLVDSGHLKDVK